MKTKLLKQLMKPQILASALVLSLLFACKPKEKPAEEAALDAAPAVAEPAAAPAAPAAEAAPAVPAVAEAAPATASSGTVRYDAQPIGSKAKIEGTSSIHDWDMNGLVLGGFIEADAKFPESALTDPNAAKPKVEVFMPVRSFKSYAKKMDERMQEAMNETKYKRIEYKLTELKPKSAAGSTGPLQFEAVGALTVAGTTKTITMPVSIEKAGGKLKVTAKDIALKMTDFGVEPPKLSILGLGAITTGDDIKVSFEWLTAPKAQ
jgi:polyisoprenoid-binding protein YceI